MFYSMADSLDYISPGTPVVWEDVRNLAEHIDKQAYEKVFQPHKDKERGSSGEICNLKYTMGVGSSYQYNTFPDLQKDVTTPFPVKFPCATNKQTDKEILYQRFEFGYYRLDPQTSEYLFEQVEERPSTYIQRYYKSGDREPVLHTMFIQKYKPELWVKAEKDAQVDPMSFSEALDENSIQNDVRPDRVSLVYNLVENKHHQLYKWWPCISHYDNKQTVSSELYFKGTIESERGIDNCVPYHRVCHAYSGKDCKNGNGNQVSTGSKVLWSNDDIQLTIVGGDRPYLAYDKTVYTFAEKEALTLNRVDYNTFSPEYFIEKTTCYGYTPPPVCQTCTKVQYPVIGWEGGNHKYDDGSAWTVYHEPLSFPKAFSDTAPMDPPDPSYDEKFTNGKYSTLYPQTIFQPNYKPGEGNTPIYKEVVGYNPREEKEGSTREYRMATYGDNWCYPEDLGAYEGCSHYELWNAQSAISGGQVQLFVRVTPILFYLDVTDLPQDSDLNNNQTVQQERTLNWAFVWVPTAIVVPIKGKYYPAIRKRWYDMMFHRLRYVAGLWEGGDVIADKINCLDKSSRGLTGTYLDGVPDDPIQALGNDFSSSVNKDELLFAEDEAHHPCGDLKGSILPDADRHAPTPIGVTWDYQTDNEISKRDDQCARWQAYGTSWSGESKDKIGESKFYCQAFFGVEHIDQLLNSISEYPIDLDYGNTTQLPSAGGFCINKEIEDCCDSIVNRSRTTIPWRGESYQACSYTTCQTKIQDATADSIPFIHTYANTINVLIDLYRFIDKHKCIELTEANKWTTVGRWTGCGSHWDKLNKQCKEHPGELDRSPFELLEYEKAIKNAKSFSGGDYNISKAETQTDCEINVAFYSPGPLEYIDGVPDSQGGTSGQILWNNKWEIDRIIGFILGDYDKQDYAIVEFRYTVKCNATGAGSTADAELHVVKVDKDKQTHLLQKQMGDYDYCGGWSSCAVKLSTSLFREAFNSQDSADKTKPLKWYVYQKPASGSTLYVTGSQGQPVDVTSKFGPGSGNKVNIGGLIINITGKSFLGSGCNSWTVKAPDTCYDDIFVDSEVKENQVVILYEDSKNTHRKIIETYEGEASGMPIWTSGVTDSIIVAVSPYKPETDPDDENSSEDEEQGLIPGTNSCNAACTVWVPYLFSGPDSDSGTREHSFTLTVSSPMKLFATKENTYHLRDNKGDTEATYEDQSSSGIPESPYVVLVKDAESYSEAQSELPCESAKPIVTAANEGGGALIKPWLAPLGIKEGLDFGLEAKLLKGQVEIDNLEFQTNEGLSEDKDTYVKKEHPDGPLKWEHIKFNVSNQYRGYIGFTIFLSAFNQDAQDYNSDLEYLAYKPKTEYFLIEIKHD